jgi:hypothetical protein
MGIEQKLSGGVLYFRRSPLDEWERDGSVFADAVNAMAALTDDQRQELAGMVCRSCGKMETGGSTCQCWNDE